MEIFHTSFILPIFVAVKWHVINNIYTSNGQAEFIFLLNLWKLHYILLQKTILITRITFCLIGISQ